eukprot:2292694-Pyramimonas_sp.AAC.1
MALRVAEWMKEAGCQVGLCADVKPLLSRPTTGEFNSPPKYLRRTPSPTPPSSPHARKAANGSAPWRCSRRCRREDRGAVGARPLKINRN